VSDLAIRLFKAALHSSVHGDLVFPASNSEMPIKKVVLPMAMATLFRNHLPGLNPATPHDLRRTAATGMRGIGVSPEIVSMILNHTRQDITGQHYDHYQGLPDRRNALNRWATHVERILGRSSIINHD
jgi:integrase